jgi:uncharacterized protein YjbJ (UPF0337 family)
VSDKLVDKAQGRVQEAAGAVNGDEGMKARGRREQAKGAVKKAAEKVTDAVASAGSGKDR